MEAREMCPSASDLLFPGILDSGLISVAQSSLAFLEHPNGTPVLHRPHLDISLSEDRLWSHFCSVLLGTRLGERVLLFEYVSFSWAHSRRESTTREPVILIFILNVQRFSQ